MSEGERAGMLPSTWPGIALALCSVPSVMSAIVLVPILPQMFALFARVHESNFWIPALVTIPGLCTALLSPLAGYLGDKLGLKPAIVLQWHNQKRRSADSMLREYGTE
jgi:MFS family permease